MSQDILFHLRNVMSDRASTKKKFGELLEDYRKEILPKVVQNWEQLSNEVQESISKMHHFYCVMHVLVHFTKSDNATINIAEQAHFDGKVLIYDRSFQKKGESGVVRLIRTACKAFAFGGDERTGCHSRFVTWIKSWLEERKVHSLPLTRFSHNRFNILHHNAVIVYCMHEKMAEFLKDDTSNPWVLHDLQQPFFIAGCKALGLVCKLVTIPLWRLLESKRHILDMNVKYLELTTFLRDSAINVVEFMLGNLRPFQDIEIKEDFWFEELVKPSGFDDDCSALLSVILPALAKLAEERFRDQLPGGIYSELSLDLWKQTTSMPLHNKLCETVFARADFLLHSKPKISMIAMESYIMFSFNKTAEWLDGKEQCEQERILQDSYKKMKDVRQKFKLRKEELAGKRAELLQAKLKEAESARKKKEVEKMMILQEISYYGLWQSESQIERNLATFEAKSDKVDALKAQLHFRKVILQQPPPSTHDKSVYNFTVVGS